MVTPARAKTTPGRAIPEQQVRTPERPKLLQGRAYSFTVKLAALLVILALWEVVVRVAAPPFIARPTGVITVLPSVVTSSEFLESVAGTAVPIIQGLAISIVLAILVGLAMGRVRWMEWALQMYVYALFALPMVALVPLMTMWLGYSEGTRLAIIIFAAFFPMALNVYDGARSVQKGYLEVAESFRVLETLYPGRIDLGIGRAPGSDQLTASALASGELPRVDDFPQKVADLLGWLHGELPPVHPFARVLAMPTGTTAPEVWLLGSSDSSGELAGKLGLPYAFAHHIRPDNLESALAAYRDAFQPSAALPAPYVVVATLVIAADTQEHASWLSSPIGITAVKMRKGFSQDKHTPAAQAAAHPYTDEERTFIRERMSGRVIGDPDTVRHRLAALLERTQPDELMAITLIQDLEDRFRSYELLAEAMAKLS